MLSTLFALFSVAVAVGVILLLARLSTDRRWVAMVGVGVGGWSLLTWTLGAEFLPI